MIEPHLEIKSRTVYCLPVKSLPAMRETWVPYLRQEDPLEKGMATHSSILAWEIPRTEEPGGHVLYHSFEGNRGELFTH